MQGSDSGVAGVTDERGGGKQRCEGRRRRQKEEEEAEEEVHDGVALTIAPRSRSVTHDAACDRV
jgi:hypothetical protein